MYGTMNETYSHMEVLGMLIRYRIYLNDCASLKLTPMSTMDWFNQFEKKF